MKQINLALSGILLMAAFTACNSDTGTTTTTTTDNTTVKSADSSNTTVNAPVNKGPLGKEDSTFVMKAAAGGLMEVQAGNIALQNATNDRVKGFASMMVNDHTKANNELTSFAAEHGMTLPTSLPPDMQKHMDAMQKMTGKAFDKHYMDMMVNDHKNDVSEFEKQTKGSGEEDLKQWAAKTLPTLQMHRDSALAISKIKF